MGNRAYLNKKNNKEQIGIFEANNYIPVFWYALLSIEIIEKNEDKLKKAFNAEDFDIDDSMIGIKKADFIANLEDAKAYFDKNNKIELFDDFINYLDSKFLKNDILELNIIEITYFDGIDKFLRDLKKEVINIKNGKNENLGDVFYLVGDDRYMLDEFKDYSKIYNIEIEDEEAKRIERENNNIKLAKKKKIYRIIEGVFMILLGIGFGFGGFLSCHYNAEILLGITGIAFGLCSIAYGIFRLKN